MSIPELKRIIVGLVVGAWAITGVEVRHSAASEDVAPQVSAFLDQYCLSCHGARKEEGGFRLDLLSRDVAGGPSGMKWAEVLERIRAAQMPPSDQPQPAAEESTRIVEWLSGKLNEGEAARLAKREHVTFNRLTRGEYANTIFDLLGVRIDVADPNGLPEDEAWHGFERIGSVLSFSPAHVEKLLAAAEAALDEAFPANPVAKFVSKRDAIDLRGNYSRTELAAAGTADKVRVDLWPGAELQGTRPGPVEPFPVSGEYRARIQLSGLKPKKGRAPHLSVYANDLDRLLFEQDVIAPEDQPTIVEFSAHLPAGRLNLRVMNDVPGPSNIPRSGRADPRIPFFGIKEGRRPWQIKLTDEGGEPIWPFLIVDWIEWSGPLSEDALTYAQREYLPDDPTDRAQVKAALSRLARRAFRRPLRDGEIDGFARLVDGELAQGESGLAALKTAMVAMLCAKDFVYLVEGKSETNETKLDDWELASRLSYFLWSTMPDQSLFDLAERGELRQPAVLRAQVRRMLRDPKARNLAETFPRNWLQLQMVGMFPPDKKLYPDYDSFLERSMVAETTEFFAAVLRQNLTLREFLDSDWTVLNPRLARHYELAEPMDDRFQPMSLPPEHHRGGLLTQAAILSLTSDGVRHRPVHRGKWVSECILGKFPPAPPANVKSIEPTPASEPKSTLRAKLDVHKRDRNCASCHRSIDPLGLAFDQFDAIGRWRTEEIVNDGAGDNPKVDASGELPDGRKFDDSTEFKRLLLADIDRFNASFVEKLATFALRRTMTVDDRAELAELGRLGKEGDYRLSLIIEELVLSELFANR